MKRGDFSYKAGHTQSHASLGRLRNQNQESRADSISRDMMHSKPNVKYYSNNEGTKTLQKKTINHRSQEEMKQKIKQLQYELKKKITDNCYLVKLFKTKNSSEVSHIDIYLEMRELEQSLTEKDTKIDELIGSLKQTQEKLEEAQQKIEEAAREIEDLLTAKDQQQIQHTNQIEVFNFQIDEIKKKFDHKLNEKIMEERKMREDKDMLLKEIQRRYEEIRQQKAKLEEILQMERNKYSKLEKEQQQRYSGLTKQLRYKISDLQDKLEKSYLRQQEKQAANEEMHKKCDSLEQLQTKARKVAEEKTNEVLEKNDEIKKYRELCQKLQQKISEQAHEMAEQNSSKENSIERVKQKLKQLEVQMAQKDKKLLENETQKIKYNKELSTMQERILQMQSKIKILTFEKEEGESAVKKITQKMEKESESLTKQIEELEMKLFTAEKRAHSVLQRLKQQQKEANDNRKKNETVSSKEIQIYKAIGRLTELSHHLKSVHPAETIKNKKSILKQASEREPENITQCVDVLAEELDLFLKKEYYPLLQQKKQLKQLYEETFCNMKDLLHAYNNFIEDEQLKGLSREFIEVIDSMESCNRKQRNTYLHMVIERLISMTAIKSYTSENGQQRTHVQRQPKHYVYSKAYENDSLQNTMERHIHIEEQPEYQVKPYCATRLDRQNSTKIISKNRYDRDTRLSRSKLNNVKMYTEPDESFKAPARKLEYEKQNIMNRINKKEPRSHIEAIKQYSSSNSLKQAEEQQTFFKDRKAEENNSNMREKLSRNGSINNGYKGGKSEQNSGYSEIEKKYYR